MLKKKENIILKKKISLNTSDHETVSQCSSSLPQHMSWKYHQNQNEADRSEDLAEGY